ncbi:MAG TPA: hypothetical protein VIA18_22780 [Polyangia bacterium]|jgi:tetratricopeptide (TPR) repeat protein|nr:hypothetical protein [Polyangia bacterium]
MKPSSAMVRVWLLCVLLVPSVAAAQEPPAPPRDPLSMSPEERTARAKALFEEGRAHVDLGDYATATREFEQAYVLKPLALFLYNLAELETYQHHRERALRLFERYLQTERDPKERALVERRMTELRQSLAKDPEPPEPPPAAAAVDANAAPVAPAAPAVVASSATVASAPPPAPAHRSRRWLWGVVAGGAVLVGGAIALGVVFGASSVGPTPSLGRGHLQ